MEVTTIHQGEAHYPEQLLRLHRSPPALYHRGTDLDVIMSKKRLAVVGSRSITPYGKEITKTLMGQIASQGVVIISGLAYGVDAASHQAALDVGGITMAVLPSPVQEPAPTDNQRLARQIIERGGALLSTYPVGVANHQYNFVQRNEYVAALSDAVLIIEGTLGSGTNRTADFALGLNMPILAVPGNINAKSSSLPNKLIQDGATAVYSAQDVFEVLQIKTSLSSTLPQGDTAEQQQLLDMIYDGLNDGQTLLERSGQSISQFNQTITMLEIAGKVRPLGGNHWGLG